VIALVAAHQIRSLRRQQVFLWVFGMLLTMTALAGVLGWLSHQTITRVYDDAVRMLASEGKPAPPNPFLLKPKLSLLSNMVVYIPLLGALLALVLGHLSVAEDEEQGIGRLIFSRPITRTGYLMGRLAGSALVLTAVLAVSVLVSALSLGLIDGSVPAGSDLGRIVLFYGLSWLYLMVFVLIGMVTVLVTQRRSLGLLAALGAWLAITFGVPQFTSGLHPSASLNPIVDPVGTTQTFFRITAALRPLSAVEQYKEASGRILAITASESAWHTTGRILPIAGLLVALALVAVALARRHDFSRSGNGE
jgi:ABC-type transport system involved in multi-copper enzyme maturation permease subunit